MSAVGTGSHWIHFAPGCVAMTCWSCAASVGDATVSVRIRRPAPCVADCAERPARMAVMNALHGRISPSCRIKRERSENEALDAVATMKKTIVVDLTEEVALTAADLSLEHGLAMADSMMLAFARENDAALVTTDSGFQGIAGVTVFSKKTKA